MVIMALVQKIKIEISFDELCEVCDTFVDVPNFAFNRAAKTFYSVLNVVIEKLLKKQLSKRNTPKFCLTFEYFEAHFLEYWLVNLEGVQPTSPLQNFINKLNQKLA